MGKTYSLNFSWISDNYFVQQKFDKPLAKGTKLVMTITAPTTITGLGYLAGISNPSGTSQYQWLDQGKDYTLSGNKITINTTINSSFDWGGFTVSIYSSQAGSTGSYTLSEATFVGDGPIIVQNDWTLTNSVGKVIKKTNEIKNNRPTYGILTTANGIKNTDGVTNIGSNNNEIGEGFGTNQFSDVNSVDLGSYPIYNCVVNSTGFGPTQPVGSNQNVKETWHPTYSDTDYNPVTGSAVIDVTSQTSSAIQLFFPIKYGSNSWKNGMLISFFVKMGANYSGSGSPFSYLAFDISCRSPQDAIGTVSTHTYQIDMSKSKSVFWANNWVEVLAYLPDLSDLYSRSLTGIGFNMVVTNGSLKYFSDPGVYPKNFTDISNEGFFVPTVG